MIAAGGGEMSHAKVYRAFCIRIFLLIVIMAVLSFTYSLSAKEVKVMMNEIETLGVFTVTLQGETQDAFLSKRKVLYFEWHYGEKGDKGWISYLTGFHSEQGLLAITPKGTLEIPLRSLRPCLSPVFSRTYTGKTIKEAPAVAQELFSETSKPVTVEEYCLESGKTYYAKVSTESYFLPPGEDGNPSEHHNTVLLISDSPFKDGMPAKEITPGYRGWTY